ncbi:hypothetical protein P3L10_014339 [Capsicum annuum]
MEDLPGSDALVMSTRGHNHVEVQNNAANLIGASNIKSGQQLPGNIGVLGDKIFEQSVGRGKQVADHVEKESFLVV